MTYTGTGAGPEPPEAAPYSSSHHLEPTYRGYAVLAAIVSAIRFAALTPREGSQWRRRRRARRSPRRHAGRPHVSLASNLLGSTGPVTAAALGPGARSTRPGSAEPTSYAVHLLMLRRPRGALPCRRPTILTLSWRPPDYVRRSIARAHTKRLKRGGARLRHAYLRANQLSPDVPRKRPARASPSSPRATERTGWSDTGTGRSDGPRRRATACARNARAGRILSNWPRVLISASEPQEVSRSSRIRFRGASFDHLALWEPFRPAHDDPQLRTSSAAWALASLFPDRRSEGEALSGAVTGASADPVERRCRLPLPMAPAPPPAAYRFGRFELDPRRGAQRAWRDVPLQDQPCSSSSLAGPARRNRDAGEIGRPVAVRRRRLRRRPHSAVRVSRASTIRRNPRFIERCRAAATPEIAVERARARQSASSA